MPMMKDSGIEWVGEIPSHWKAQKTKYNFINTKYIPGIHAKEYARLSLTLRGVLPRDKDDADGLQPKDFYTYQLLKKDELVFKLIDLQNVSTSRVGLAHDTGLVSPAYIVLHANGDVLPAFAEKYFLMLWHREIFNALGDNGVRSSLNASDLLNVPICFPSMEEQEKIASFLDSKCAEIDALSADIQAEIDTLEEYKKSAVFEAVTKGLNPDVEMKDSGTEWLGQIPVAWELSRIGSLYTLRNTKVSDKDYPPLSVTMNGIVPQLETAAKTNAHDDRKLVKKGDFAINSRSDRRGSCGISDYDGSVSLINTILSPKGEMNPRYYNWLFHTVQFADEFYANGHGIVDDLWTTGWQEMKKILIPSPSMEEQEKIASFLDAKCSEIDIVVMTKKEQLATLDEYKKSVIYEYVTGKKEVPNE